MCDNGKNEVIDSIQLFFDHNSPNAIGFLKLFERLSKIILSATDPGLHLINVTLSKCKDDK